MRPRKKCLTVVASSTGKKIGKILYILRVFVSGMVSPAEDYGNAILFNSQVLL